MRQSIKETQTFTLVLKNVDEKTPGLEDALFQAGCDDALINFRNGTVYLDFDREAESIEVAVMSAIKAVELGLPGVAVVSVAPEDWVTESDIAKRLSCKRQTISLWTQEKRRKDKPFPKPVMKLADRSPLWKWKDIAEWLHLNKSLDKKSVKAATFMENINAALAERDPNIRVSRRKLLVKLDALRAVSKMETAHKNKRG